MGELEYLESVGIDTAAKRQYVAVETRGADDDFVARRVYWHCSIRQALAWNERRTFAGERTLPAEVAECGEIMKGEEMGVLGLFALPAYKRGAER